MTVVPQLELIHNLVLNVCLQRLLARRHSLVIKDAAISNGGRRVVVIWTGSQTHTRPFGTLLHLPSDVRRQQEVSTDPQREQTMKMVMMTQPANTRVTDCPPPLSAPPLVGGGGS